MYHASVRASYQHRRKMARSYLHFSRRQSPQAPSALARLKEADAIYKSTRTRAYAQAFDDLISKMVDGDLHVFWTLYRPCALTRLPHRPNTSLDPLTAATFWREVFADHEAETTLRSLLLTPTHPLLTPTGLA